jgi:hypothetical protein
MYGKPRLDRNPGNEVLGSGMTSNYRKKSCGCGHSKAFHYHPGTMAAVLRREVKWANFSLAANMSHDI